MALRPANILGLCAGTGGLELGIALAVPEARSICYVEREAAAAASLVASMEAGWFHPAPVWSDLLTFDARPWRGLVHILASGDPCQDNSVAGKRAGADGERFLAPEVVRIADECRPDLIFRENVPGNAGEQLAAIAPPLERLGYRVAAGVFSSAETGNTMRRERLFIMAERYGAGQHEYSQLDREPEQSKQHARSRRHTLRCGDEVGGTANLGHERSGSARRRRLRPADASGSVGSPIGCGDGWDEGNARRHPIGRASADRPSSASGRELGQPESIGPREGGTEHAREQGRRAPAGTGGAMGGANGLGRWAEGHAGQPSKHALQSGSRGLRLPPAVIPGPTDNRWIDVLDRWPELQPALSKEEAESHLRRGIDAMAHRVERLRATGNGVDPVVAAYAFLRLSARLAEGRSARDTVLMDAAA